MKWIKVCNVGDFQHTFYFKHRRTEIALFKIEDGIYATDNSCSHEYSPLCEGIVMDGKVYCPKHGSRFDIKTGAVIDLPATAPIKTYAVKIEDEEIFVRI